MKTLLYFSLGFFLGGVFMIAGLAYRSPGLPSEDAFTIQAFRQMGCDPYVGEHRALHGGCQFIKPIKLGEP